MIPAATVAEASAETFTGLMDHVAQGFEALGAAILVVGVVWSFVLATPDPHGAARSRPGRRTRRRRQAGFRDGQIMTVTPRPVRKNQRILT